MKLYLIAGNSGHGKDTLALKMKKEYESMGLKTCIFHIAAPLYTYAKNYFEWDEINDPKPREFLQKMGIEIIKQKLNKPFFLIDRLTEDIEILDHFFDVGIIADGRLPEEFIELKKRFLNMIMIHIDRPNFENKLTKEEQQHITENTSSEDFDYDYKVINTTFEELEASAKKIVIYERRKGDINYE